MNGSGPVYEIELRELMQKVFKQVYRHFEQVKRRLNELSRWMFQFMLWVFGLAVSMTGVIIGGGRDEGGRAIGDSAAGS